jgi:hypothetical protein
VEPDDAPRPLTPASLPALRTGGACAAPRRTPSGPTARWAPSHVRQRLPTGRPGVRTGVSPTGAGAPGVSVMTP